MKRKDNWHTGKDLKRSTSKIKNPNIGFLSKVGNLPAAHINYYNFSLFLNKFFNSFIRSGKKNKTFKLLTELTFLIRFKTPYSTRRFFYQVTQNIFPLVMFKTQHMGHMKHDVPTLATIKDQVFLSVRWIIGSIKNRKERSLTDRVFNELLDIVNKKKDCESLKRKNVHYRLAFNNKPFVRYLKFIYSKK